MLVRPLDSRLSLFFTSFNMILCKIRFPMESGARVLAVAPNSLQPYPTWGHLCVIDEGIGCQNFFQHFFKHHLSGVLHPISGTREKANT